MSVRIGHLSVEDAGEAFTVQRAAYVSEAQRYDTPHITPLLETLDELRADLSSPDVLGFGAWLGPRLVGAVRGRPAGQRMEVARLVVAPDMQGRGIGRVLLASLESAAAERGMRALWLVTGAASDGNLRMYKRAGYDIVSERTDSAGVALFVFEKPLQPLSP